MKTQKVYAIGAFINEKFEIAVKLENFQLAIFEDRESALEELGNRKLTFQQKSDLIVMELDLKLPPFKQEITLEDAKKIVEEKLGKKVIFLKD